MKNVTNLRLVGKLVALAALLTLAVLALPRAYAQADGQKTFSSSKEAVEAFIQAVRGGNDPTLLAILGPGTEAMISTSDAVADKSGRDRFLARYDVKHSLTESARNQLSLNVGKDGWPFPIPLVHANDKWYWDGAAGKEEILYRRIGSNELAAIDVCKGLVAAQHDYAATGHDGLPAGIFAQRIVSEPGKQNGLYWQVSEGQSPSPAGPLLAQASAEGYGGGQKGSPYHGYYYRILTAQGADAKAGAKSYVIDGMMTGGFAVIAYPADYRSSGVMTFLVNQNGAIHQKDLGEQTAELAQQMSDYNPDKSWRVVK
ncbi:MAG: DUF2950 domain-containing protein [Candidatus Sulfotelmatobacter sp.]